MARGRTTTIVTAALGAAALLVAAPATAAPASSYGTGFEDVTITSSTTTMWHMSGPYDAAITEGTDPALRISNAVTSGSFGDQLFSPELAVGATENGPETVFDAEFTLLPVALQDGLRVTVSPDNGSGARSGFLAIEHTATGVKLVSSGSNGAATNWKDVTIAEGLAADASHVVAMRVQKIGNGKNSANNDVFSVKVDNGPWIANKTFEAYYRAVGEPQPEADTLLFRVSGTAVSDLRGGGLLIDDLTMSTS